jgi:hypothetical protein
MLFQTVAVKICLSAKPLLSNGCCIFAYLLVVAQQWVYMPQCVKHLEIIIDTYITSSVAAYS